MSYRGVNANRQRAQMQSVTMQAGFTGTWRRFVSADAGQPNFGLSGNAYYTEIVITAVIAVGRGRATTPETQTPAGMIAAGTFPIVTRDEFGRRDGFVWQGNTYRIESDSVRSPVSNQWTTIIKRGN